MVKELSYKMPENDPNYVLVHKRALIAQSHCIGLAFKSYSICSGQDIQEVTQQFSYYANCHAHELSQEQLDYIVNQLIKHQGDSGILELGDILNESTN